MLQELRVENVALIQEATLQFGPGLNVMTGETGAGKSILVNSMKMLMGTRADTRSLRKGADLERIEGVFSVNDNNPVRQMLADLGLSMDDELLIMTREVTPKGKNTCRINRRTVTLRDFQQVSQYLINIFGQHDHATLTDPERQLALLDSLGGPEHGLLLTEVRQAYQDTRKKAAALKKFIEAGKLREKARREAEAALAELRPLKLQKGEEAAVSAEFKQLMAYEEIRQWGEQAYQALYGADGAAQVTIREAIYALQQAASLDDVYAPLVKELSTALIVVEETAHSILNARKEPDPARIEQLTRRLELYEQLRRKYHRHVDELLEAMNDWQKAIALDEGATETLERMKNEYLKAKVHYEKQSLNLRASRKTLAGHFSQRLLVELADLAMAYARFEVAFTEAPASSRGEDAVTFMLSANPGTDLAPLHEIASGGEMSRIMLAFKTILAGDHGLETLIFDEIDTGIGGMTLNAVADKLARVAEQEQVICVTHAAPIAAQADEHFYIEKNTDGTTTDLTVRKLLLEERTAEIARMIGGHDDWHMAYASHLRSDTEE